MAMTEKAIAISDRQKHLQNEGRNCTYGPNDADPPNQKCDSESHGNVPEAILKGYSEYEGPVPKSSLECQLEHMQQNKKEPRNSFKVATCRRAAGVYWKATAGLGTQAGNKTKHAFDQMQRLEKKVENNIAMNKCQEVIEKESADTLTLEQQLPRRACKLQTEHTKQWGTCYRERCLK